MSDTKPPREPRPEDCLSGGGEMGAVMRYRPVLGQKHPAALGARLRSGEGTKDVRLVLPPCQLAANRRDS